MCQFSHPAGEERERWEDCCYLLQLVLKRVGLRLGKCHF